jgi:UDP-N-acetylglucosamine 2-epimerase (non-hydrolysing)
MADGWNVLVHPSTVAKELERAALRPTPSIPPGAPFGDGRAAARVVAELERFARGSRVVN